MRLSIFVSTVALAVGLVGCAPLPPPAASDNSSFTGNNPKELESLESQIEELQKQIATATADNTSELNSLKSQVEELQKENRELGVQLQAAMVPTATIESTAVVASSDSGEPVPIGQAASLSDWSIVTTSIEVLDAIGYSDKPDPGNKYLQVNATVTNNGKYEAKFLPGTWDFSLGDKDEVGVIIIYGDGYEFKSTDLQSGDDLHDEYIVPLASKGGFIAFEIPDSVAISTDQLLLQFVVGSEKTTIKVR